MLTTLLPIFACIILSVVGQLLLKRGMISMGKLDLGAASPIAIIWQMATSPYVIGGLLVYGVSTVIWMLVLNRVQLSYAYPFISLSYVLIFALSWLLFREDISQVRIVGMLIICLGVFVIARS